MNGRKMQGMARLAMLAVMMAAALGTGAWAQFNASLSGTVQDATGAAIPGASVTLLNLETQASQTATSTGEGFYKFNELAAAHYKLTVTASGFQGSTVGDLTLVAETPRNVDVKLAPGGSTETVTVSADTLPVLQTADANIQTTIDGEEIKRLPTFGADPYELLRTAPGIIGDGARSGSGAAVFLPNAAGPGGSNSGVFQTENQIQISADGQRQADNNFMIDGVSVNSLTHGGSAVVTPNQEAVGSMTVVSTSYDASDGRNSGAQIKVVTHSGSNELHGSAFLLYDEPGLNAYNRYGGPVAGTRPARVATKQRSYAASLGGPIIKDKLFLFASFAGFGLGNNTTTTSYVETPQFRAAVAAQRTGGVTAAILADPGSQPRILGVVAPSCSGFGAGTCAIVGGGLDIGSLTPGGASQLGVFPGSITGGGLDGVPDVENVQLSVPSHSRGRQFNGRLDFNVTHKDLVAFSTYITKLDNYGPSGTAGSRPDTDLPFKPLNSAGTAIWIHTISPNTLNELRGNATRFAENGLNDAGGVVNFGLPYVNVQNYPFPVQYGPNYSGVSPAIFAENTYEIRDQLTHTFGAHTLRIGYEARFEQDNDNLLGQERPTYAFGGLFAFANDASVYEAVAANPLTGQPATAQRYFRSNDFAAYVQHDWKATQNLQFNAGIRWEEFTPLRNKGSQINYPVLGTTPGRELVDIALGAHDHLWNFQHKDFAPKIGFAYTPPTLGQKMVIRGGFALAFNHLDIALFNNALENGPGYASFGLCCGGNGNTAGILYAIGSSHSPTSFPANPALKTGIGANGFPNQVGGAAASQNTTGVEVYGAPTNTQPPVSYLFSFETQYDLSHGMSTIVGYQGSLGHHYARLVNQNFIYNQCFPATVNCAGATKFTPVSAAYFAQTDSYQNYNALNAMLRKRLTHGLGFSAAYTFSKSLDEVSNGDAADSNANQTNPANNASEYGPSDYNAKHRVTGTALFETPKVHTANKLVQAVANGFQINAIVTYHTGFPWTPVTYNIQTNPNQIGAARAGPVRPTAYLGGAGNSCSNDAYKSGSNFPNRSAANPGGGNYFVSSIVNANVGYVPGIGRNSFQGPCYFDTDFSVAKEFGFDTLDRHMLLRINANFYNAFNKLQLSPITNGNANPGANIQNQYFGYAQGADAGRQIELTARLQF